MEARARSLLLGWGNALPSQLVAYERLHRALGLEPLSVIPDVAAGLVRPSAYAQALAPLAEALTRETRPIVVQLFSDNGFVGWAALLDALARTDAGRRARDAIRGVVLDSSPGLWAVRGRVDFARRFAGAMTPPIARSLRFGARERLPIVTPALTAAFVAYQLAFPASVRVMLSASERVATYQPRCPHLFLYGEDDRLVPTSDVCAWIAIQRERGIEIEDHVFAAPHVALYPKDPRRYRSTLSAFFDRVLLR